MFGKIPCDDEDIIEAGDRRWSMDSEDPGRRPPRLCSTRVRADEKLRRGSLQRARVRGRDELGGLFAPP